MLLLVCADFFKINFFIKVLQEHYQSVKPFASEVLQRLSAELPLAREELIYLNKVAYLVYC